MTPRRLNALRWTTEEKDTVWTAGTDTKHRTADKEKAEFPWNSRRWKCAHVDGYKHITETPSCRQITVHAQRPDKIREQLLHLRVWDLGGFLRQAAALCRDQVVVLGADVLVWIVKTAWTGSGRRSGGKKDKNRTILNDPAARCHHPKNFTELLIILAFHDDLLKSVGCLKNDCFL